MEKIIALIQNHELTINILAKINELRPADIRLIIIITAVLIMFLVAKRLGLRMAMALGMVYLIIYVLYINNFLGAYLVSTQDKEDRFNDLQAELRKK